MKFLLVGINTKYIHSNAAIRLLKTYAESKLGANNSTTRTDSTSAFDAEIELTGSTAAANNSTTRTDSTAAFDAEIELPRSTAAANNSTKLTESASAFDAEIELAEYTINNRLEEILSDLYLRKPDVILFSCYIWNWNMVSSLSKELPKVLPKTEIWLGGPEVSFDADIILKSHKEIKGVMIGEGEAVFTNLVEEYMADYKKTAETEFQTNDSVSINCEKKTSDFSNVPDLCLQASDFSNVPGLCPQAPGFSNVPGLCLQAPDFSSVPGLCLQASEPFFTKPAELLNMDEIPFLYSEENINDFEHKIIYYESSRGCPFSCSYCLSSVDKHVRFLSNERTARDLQFFLDHKIPQVKFVDRTFNCNHTHSEFILQYLLDHDNGVTNFHFEIAGDILTETEIGLLSKMRPGLVQLEIGVQSTNPETIKEIHRVMDLNKLKKIVDRIHEAKNVHQHLDLIAGLPFEDLESFKKSFNDVYAMKPDQLQLGFLKVLKGSFMATKVDDYQIKFTDEAPYEVLSTAWLSYSDVLKLKKVEAMVDLYYNSNQFVNTLKVLIKAFPSAYDLFEKLASYYEEQNYFVQSPARVYRYNILLEFAIKYDPSNDDLYKELLTFDMYLRENCKSRPNFAKDLKPYFDLTKEYRKTNLKHADVFKYTVWEDEPEKLSQETLVLFDYTDRDPLSNNAAFKIV